MRWVAVGVGALMMLTGGVWTLQGVGIVPGSFMTGQSFWALVGFPLFLGGVAVCAFGLRRGTVGPRP